MRILVIEDDPFVAQVLEHLMASQSYATDLVATGHQGLEMLDSFPYDLVILDLQLPDMNGLSLCQQLRSKGKTIPVLLVTGTNNPAQKAAALNTGADDYVVKPFDSQEFMARVLALLRRSGQITLPKLTWGLLQLDPACRQVCYGQQELTLTPKEYAMLELLLRHGEQVFSAQAILDQVWTAQELPMEEAVRTHIKGLRQKLKAAGADPRLIETVHRVGYRLNPSMRYSFPRRPEPSPRVDDPALRLTHAPRRPEVLIVSPDGDGLGQMRSHLPADRFQVVGITEVQQLGTVLQRTWPDVLILDATSDPCVGLDLCRNLRSQPQWRRLPIIMVLSDKTVDSVREVFAAGANDFVMEPIVGPELLTRIFAQFKVDP